MISLLLLLAHPSALAETTLPAPHPMALVQAWATLYDQDTDPVADPAGYGDPEDDSGLKLRRARLGLEGQDETVRYGLVFGMSAPYDGVGGTGEDTISLVDAYGGIQATQGIWITGGVQKVPVSRELLMSARDLPLGERSVAANWLVPGRDAGVVMDSRWAGEDASLSGRARLGVFNGNGSALGDDNAGKLVAARTEITWGPADPYQTWGVAESLTLGVALDGWQDVDLSTSTLGYGADLIVRCSAWTMLGEYRMANLGPTLTDLEAPSVWAETKRSGWMGQLGWTWGSWEAVVRADAFDDSANVEDNGDVLHGMAGATWHAADDRVRIGGGWVHRQEQGGAPSDNDTLRAWLQLSI